MPYLHNRHPYKYKRTANRVLQRSTLCFKYELDY